MLKRKWFLLRHIAHSGDMWVPVRAQSIFGRPLVTFFFTAWGPFNSPEDALGRLRTHYLCGSEIVKRKTPLFSERILQQQLAKINEQLAMEKEQNKRFWFFIGSIFTLGILPLVVNFINRPRWR
jgi:hypothetical protein